MPKFIDMINPFSSKNHMQKWSKNAINATGDFLSGTPGSIEQVSTLTPEQEKLHGELTNAAKGGFQSAADYYKSNLSDNPADFAAFAAPQLRQYNEEIVPGLSEQFAGMGSGGLSSSVFRNAQIQGATDLSERLGALRANLRQSAAQGLTNLGSLGLQNVQQNYQVPGTEGFLSSMAPAIGGAIGTAVGGPIGGALGAGVGSWFGGSGNRVGANSGPYGQNPQASPRMA